MDNKNMMKVLYKHFGEKKEDGQDMHSIANIFHEMGSKEEAKEESEWINIK